MNALKQQAISFIQNLPDDSITSWDDIMYEFYVKQKVEKAIEQADKGETISHEEVKKRLLSE